MATNGDDDDVEAPVSGVPAKALEAANSAVPGGEIAKVEKEVGNSGIIYEVEKVVDGVEYDIDVTADGVVKEVGTEDDEDDDD